MTSPSIQASKQGLASVKKKLDANQAKQDAIRLEISRLQAKLDVLHYERSGTLTEECEEASKNHSRSWCLDFAQTIAERLPRELRDMVYGYLLDEDKQNVVRIEPTYVKPHEPYIVKGHVYFFCHAQHSLSSTLPHYLMTKFMGAEIGGEIGQTFYMQSEFIVSHINDLHSFLTDNPLRVA